MKLRTGFVSNSSSSSFVCDITGATESGYDASARDCGFAQCSNGHTFVEGLLLLMGAKTGLRQAQPERVEPVAF